MRPSGSTSLINPLKWRDPCLPSGLDQFNFTALGIGTCFLEATGDKWTDELYKARIADREPCETVSEDDGARTALAVWLMGTGINTHPSIYPYVLHAVCPRNEVDPHSPDLVTVFRRYYVRWITMGADRMLRLRNLRLRLYRARNPEQAKCKYRRTGVGKYDVLIILLVRYRVGLSLRGGGFRRRRPTVFAPTTDTWRIQQTRDRQMSHFTSGRRFWAVGWGGTFPKHAPNKSMIDTVSSDRRQCEYQNALRTAYALGNWKPAIQRERGEWSAAHGAMPPNATDSFARCRLPPTAWMSEADESLRIFEIELRGGGTRTQVHGFRNAENTTIGQKTALCVWSGHARLLLPASITTPNRWKECINVNAVLRDPWIRRDGDLAIDESLVMAYNSENCRICTLKARIPRRNLFIPTVVHRGTAGPTRVEAHFNLSGEWWGQWNPWANSAGNNGQRC